MLFLVIVSVIGNRSSCLSHASLIVPWPVLSCQLQPAFASENQRKRAKEEHAAAGGEGTEANHYTEREREEKDDGFSWQKKYHFCYLVKEGGIKKLQTDWNQIGCLIFPKEDKCLKYECSRSRV